MAFRSKAQRAINGCSLDKRCNAVCGTPSKRPAGEFVRVPGCVASFGKGTTIPCRTRLARNADKLTESNNLNLDRVLV